MKYLLLFVPPYWHHLPPLNIALLSSVLSKKNIPYDILDLNIIFFHNVEKIDKVIWNDVTIQNSNTSYDTLVTKYKKLTDKYISEIIDKNYTHLCFSVYSSNFLMSYFISNIIKKKNKNIKIIFGGPEILYKYIENKNFYNDYPDVDIFVVGEGENPLNKIIAGNNNKLFIFDELNNPEEIPIPVYKEELLNLYIRKRALPILANRGCINKCKFCAEKFLYKKIKIRKSKQIFDEIITLKNIHNIIWFTFYDSMLNIDYNEILNLCDLLIENNVNIKWDCQFYLKNYSLELLNKMKKAGCFNLFVGLESGSDAILKRMNKDFDLSDAEKFFIDCKKADLHFEISLILNYNNETENEFNETINFLKKNKNLIPKIAQINNYKELPGTFIKEINKENQRTKKLINELNKDNFILTKKFIKNLNF